MKFKDSLAAFQFKIFRIKNIFGCNSLPKKQKVNKLSSRDIGSRALGKYILTRFLFVDYISYTPKFIKMLKLNRTTFFVYILSRTILHLNFDGGSNLSFCLKSTSNFID